MESHRKASAAIENGHIAKQIPIMNGKKVVDKDNLVRSVMKPEKLQKMRPVFDKVAGTITAATSSAFDRWCFRRIVDARIYCQRTWFETTCIPQKLRISGSGSA